MGLKQRFHNAWNAFQQRSPTEDLTYYGSASSYRLDRNILRPTTVRSLMGPVVNRIGVDVADIYICHARVDENKKFVETIDSELNNVLTMEANIDQDGRSFVQDVAMSMMDEGVIAVVPTVADRDITKFDTYKIYEARVAKIKEWYPYHVKVECYNILSGRKEEITLPKSDVAILENPFFSIMNEPTCYMQRLLTKMSQLDTVDSASASSKLNLIFQLPFSTRSPERRRIADERLGELESQLANSPHGVAYIDTTEHVTQLNRSFDNNLLSQVQYLDEQLHSQLGLTKSIFDGTADEQTMLNYYNRTVQPILDCITKEFTRKFLTKTARSQGQSIIYLRDPFKLIPPSQLPDLSDKLTRNAIVSTNEVRAAIGRKPSDDPDADRLRNKNLNLSDNEVNNIYNEKEDT